MIAPSRVLRIATSVGVTHDPRVIVMPLKRRVRGSSTQIPEPWTLITDGRHAEELHVTGIWQEHLDELRPILERDYPEMVSLSLHGDSNTSCYWYGVSPVLSLSTVTAAALRSLHIKTITVVPDVQLPSLTHLALDGVDWKKEHNPYETVAGLLQRCPNLEALVLSNPSGFYEVGYHKPPRDVGLERLRRVTLQGDGFPRWLPLIPCREDGPSIQALYTYPHGGHGPFIGCQK